MEFHLSQGKPIPYGAHATPKGVNFSVFAQNLSSIVLIIMNIQTKKVIYQWEIPYQTGQIKHLFVEGLQPPFAYAYKIRTPDAEEFIISDPYAPTIFSSPIWNDSEPYQPLGCLLPDSNFDWENDKPLSRPKEDLIIYEMHVRGFTQDPSSGIKHPGTFLGIIEKIPYLQDLGINAIELMPIQEFDEKDYVSLEPNMPQLFQYWGYSNFNFFSPMNRYATEAYPGASIREFKEMVKSLHHAGIEVILDIVLNHTAEGNERGPVYSFKGLASDVYYIHTQTGAYANYSGCGNTLNCNHPVTTEFILEVLRYWVTEMHVDGFRFDLASIFYRGPNGAPLSLPPVINAITKDPILSASKLIAEPWDAAGLYQVGGFFPESVRWSEWNGKYRDCIRRFIKGSPGTKGEFATRISGSEDLYGHDQRLPRNSINFIIAHDGFTLHDLVSYDVKHNENNGENNRDGANQNDSWNCGIEGPTLDPLILKLREKQMRNFHLALMVSQGVPMLHMGDEYGHTKQGNNNTWCQDNALNWFQWSELRTQSAFYRFYRGLIHFRRNNAILRHRKFLRDDDIAWHGKIPYEPTWGVDDSFIAFTLIDKTRGFDLYIAFNASNQEALVSLPTRKDEKSWRWIVNTALSSPHDFHEESQSIRAFSPQFSMPSYSSVLLKAL